MCKAHSLVYHSTLGLRVIEKRARERCVRTSSCARGSGLGLRVKVLGCRVESFSRAVLRVSLELCLTWVDLSFPLHKLTDLH